METIAAFVRAVFSHGEPLAGGLVVSFIVKGFEWWFSRLSRQAPWQVHGMISAVCLLVACFFAWDEEYKARHELAAAKPHFQLSIVRQAFGDAGENTLIVQVIVHITNVGKMRSAAGGWHLSLTDPSGIQLPIEQVSPEKFTMEYRDGRKEAIGEADLIDRKTITTPIEVGAQVQGVIYGHVRGLQPEDIKHGYTAHIVCVDVFNTPYKASLSVPAKLPPGAHRRLPGLETQRIE